MLSLFSTEICVKMAARYHRKVDCGTMEGDLLGLLTKAESGKGNVLQPAMLSSPEHQKYYSLRGRDP